MAESKKQKTSIELVYMQEDARALELNPLANELRSRGYEVTLRRYAPLSGIADEISRSAKDFTDGVRGVAETGMQKIRDAFEPFMPHGTKKGEEYVSSSKVAASEKSEVSDDESPFASIGPEANSQASDRVIVSSSIEAIKDLGWESYRIGLMPHTVLDKTWQASQFDAMVIPHPSFRQYLEHIRWAPERIFEGGYLALKSEMPTASVSELRERFKLSSEDGSVVLVMASHFKPSELQTIMLQLSLLRTPYQAFFYHADDAMVSDVLRAHARRFNVNARMFGRLEPLTDYLAIADIAVIDNSDPGLLLLQNAGVPCIGIAAQFPSARLNFLIHSKAAQCISQSHQLAKALTHVLSEPNVLLELKAAASAIIEYASIERCADAIEQALAGRGSVMSDPKRSYNQSAGFEIIGNVNTPVLLEQPTFLTPTSIDTRSFDAFEQRVDAMETVQRVQPLPVFPTTEFPRNYEYARDRTTIPEEALGILSPSISSRSVKQLQQEYAQLLIVEKDIDRSLDAANDEVRKWELRLDLAKQHQNPALTTQAILQLDTAKNREIALYQQKDLIASQKAMLKQSARQAQWPNQSSRRLQDDDLFSLSPEDDDLEKQFQQLQRMQQIQALRDRLK